MKNEQIRLYLWDLSPLFDGAWSAYLPLLPPERRGRARRLRRDRDAARCVGAWLLLREALRLEGRDIRALSLRTGAWGKPFFEGGPEFSLSHAGPWAAAAVAAEPVGVDIEAARCTLDLARRFFTPEETAAAEALPEEERRRYLQRLWVAKEAFLKALGTGLHTPLDAFTVALGEEAVLSQTLTPRPLRLTEFSAGEYLGAVAGVGEVTRRILSPWAPDGSLP